MTLDSFPSSGVVMTPPDTGPITWAMGSLFEHVIGAEQTGGAFAVSLVTQPPGVATPLHRHSREAEAFYLLDGTITYRAGEATFELVAGCFMYLPAEIPHAFRITGDVPARFLALTVPGGLMDLYDAVGVAATERRLPGDDGREMPDEIARWNEFGPRFGIDVVGPPIPA